MALSRLPPKRGQVKVKIVSSLVKSVVSVASKVGRGLSCRRKVATQVVQAAVQPDSDQINRV
ncbi:hypothetical protein D8674_011270 [Pyrus ussuriensis x Pyrus communis]|uniref:Uncharacterized protein n=1 Tax=Pyrus ussuriensis x Pyrus communis TaxID=2448454 RepID=A0A5N5G3V0_9ROSA|nr:hypothetical protein D8674_011270 [Pyrus ussuriensis x Pyrus communis]